MTKTKLPSINNKINQPKELLKTTSFDLSAALTDYSNDANQDIFLNSSKKTFIQTIHSNLPSNTKCNFRITTKSSKNQQDNKSKNTLPNINILEDQKQEVRVIECKNGRYYCKVDSAKELSKNRKKSINLNQKETMNGYGAFIWNDKSKIQIYIGNWKDGKMFDNNGSIFIISDNKLMCHKGNFSDNKITNKTISSYNNYQELNNKLKDFNLNIDPPQEIPKNNIKNPSLPTLNSSKYR